MEQIDVFITVANDDEANIIKSILPSVWMQKKGINTHQLRLATALIFYSIYFLIYLLETHYAIFMQPEWAVLYIPRYSL